MIPRKGRNTIFFSLILLGIAFLVALILAPFGEKPWDGMVLLLQGSLGSVRRLSETLVRTSPLLFTGLGVALAFRSGALNIGAEGQFLMGAIGSVVVGAHLGGFPPWLAVGLTLSGAWIAGGVWGGIAGLLKAWRGVPEVISTIMLNFIALYWLSALIRGPIRNTVSGLPESVEIASVAEIPRLVSGMRVHYGLLLGIVAAVAIHFLLARTVLGYKMRAVGFNPVAARFAGFSPEATWAGTMALSGALAGLGGGVEVCAVTFRVYDGFSPGYGYTAIAVALLARLHPIGVILSAFFFAVLEQGAGTLQRELQVPLVMSFVVEGLVIILALLLGFYHPTEETD